MVKPERLNTGRKTGHECSAWPTEYRIGEVIMNPASRLVVLRGGLTNARVIGKRRQEAIPCALN